MKRLFFIIAAMLLIAAPASAQQQQSKVRAIFLLQFARYATWPIEENDQSFVMTVVGSDDVASELRTITRGKTIKGRTIDIVTSTSARNLPKSDVIYLGEEFADKTQKVIDDQYGRRTLVVGSKEGMCEQGAQVALTEEGNKIGFEWSKRNVDRGGVRVNPKVLLMGKELN